jgi:transcriptional regulator GlxA family with amidase domain
MVGRLILYEVAAAAALPFELPLPAEGALRPAVSALHADLSRPLGVDEAARLCKMSERTFARRFLAATGLSWGRWRDGMRLVGARRLLERGVSVGEAARSCGYDSPSAFAAAFVRRFGVRPRQIASSARQARDGGYESVDVLG